MKPKLCSGCPYKKKCKFEISKGARLIINSHTQCKYYFGFKAVEKNK